MFFMYVMPLRRGQKNMVGDSVCIPCFCGLTKVNGIYYGNRFDMNGLFSLNFDNSTINLEEIYDKEALFSTWRYCVPVYADNVLYNIPCAADNIVVYSLTNVGASYINFDDPHVKEAKLKFDNAFLRGNKLWMIPKGCLYFVELDIYSGELYYHDGFGNIIKNIAKDDWPFYVRKSFVLGNKAFLILWKAPDLIEYDTVNGTFFRIKLTRSDEWIVDIVPFSKGYIYISSDGCLCAYVNGNKVQIEHIDNIDDISGLLLVDEMVWVIYISSPFIKIISFDIQLNNFHVDNVTLESKLHKGYFWYDGNSKIYNLPDTYDRMTNVIDKNSFSIEKIHFKLNTLGQKKYIEAIKEASICYEKQLSIEDFFKIKIDNICDKY